MGFMGASPNCPTGGLHEFSIHGANSPYSGHTMRKYTNHLDAWLEEDGGGPLELCHQLVAHVLGFKGEVDFYDALVKRHQTSVPRPSFTVEGTKSSAGPAHMILRFSKGAMATRS
jgi:hypothetical protein